MKFIVTINLDDDAFADALRNLEVAAMLHSAARKVAEDTTRGRLVDHNGNTIGTFGFNKQ